jgi:hypothetical protein
MSWIKAKSGDPIVRASANGKGLKMDYLSYLMTIPNLQDYVGKWIALVDKEIVASGDNGKTVFELAKSKYPKKEPFIMKLPAETVMLL